MNTYEDIALEGKKVFLRVDLNVPLIEGKILVDHKLKAILPTINYIHENGGKVVLATHIGRPKLKQGEYYTFDKKFSTRILLPWFKEQGTEITYVENINDAKSIDSPFVLLENMRLFSGEQEGSTQFAKDLSELADVYINDAFGSLHRNDTSIALLPNQFPPENKGIGMLVEKELEELTKLKANPSHPFVLVLGGNKVSDKIPMIQNFFELPEETRPSAIIIGGAIAYTFLKAQGSEVGKSFVEEQSLTVANEILQKSHTANIKIILPKDSLITLNDEVRMIPHNEFPATGVGVDIGQSSIDTFIKKIEKAHTIFANGTMGIYSNPNYANGTKVIMKTIAKSHAFSVVGGGDAVAAVYKFKLENKFNFLSTGGGATLKFLSIKPNSEINELAGLKALK